MKTKFGSRADLAAWEVGAPGMGHAMKHASARTAALAQLITRKKPKQRPARRPGTDAGLFMEFILAIMERRVPCHWHSPGNPTSRCSQAPRCSSELPLHTGRAALA